MTQNTTTPANDNTIPAFEEVWIDFIDELLREFVPAQKVIDGD